MKRALIGAVVLFAATLALGQAMPPGGGGSSYTHPSSIDLPQGFTSGDGGTISGTVIMQGTYPGDGGSGAVVQNGLTTYTDGGFAGLVILGAEGSASEAIRIGSSSAPNGVIKWGTGFGSQIGNTGGNLSLSSSIIYVYPSIANSGGDLWVNDTFKLGASGDTTKNVVTGTGTLDFPNNASWACDDLTVTVTDAVTTNTPACQVGWVPDVADGTAYCWVSASNTVTVRACYTGDPASATVRATVTQY